MRSPLVIFPPYCEILATGLPPRALHHCLVKGLCATLEPHLKRLWRKSYVFQNKQKVWENGPLEAAFTCVAAKFYKFLFLLYVSHSLEFSSKIEMLNKFNSFVHVIPHLSFAMTMFWGPFLRTCPLILIFTSVQVVSVSASNGSVNSLSTCKIKSNLHFR